MRALTGRPCIWTLGALLLSPHALRGAATSGDAAKDPLDAVAAAVVEVTSKWDGRTVSATGFVWGKERLVVTALHAVAGADTATITLYYQAAKVSRSGHVRAVLRGSDLALLQVDAPPAVTGLELAPAPPRPGERVTALGYPLGIRTCNSVEMTVRRIGGKVLKDIVDDDTAAALGAFGFPALDGEILNLEGSLQPGHSGAPILREDGRLVGVGDGGLARGAAALSWAIPAARLASLAASREKPPTRSELSGGKVAIRALFSAELGGDFAAGLIEHELAGKRVDPGENGRPGARPATVPARAATLAAHITETDPLDARILKAIAERRFAEARQWLDQRRQQGGSTSTSRDDRLTGDTWYYEARYAEALGWYQKVLGRAPDDVAAQDSLAVCLLAMHRPLEALPYFTTTVASYNLLADKTGEAKWTAGLAQALVNRGLTASALRRHDDALKDFAKAVGLRTRLVDQERHAELENDLAEAFNLCGVALAALGRYDDALASYEKAIRIRRRLVERESRTELGGDLAQALNNRGNTLVNLSRSEEALRAYSEAVELLDRLMSQGSAAADTADDLAAALKNRGNTLFKLGRSAEALADQNRAVELRTRLVDREGRTDLADRLASALTSRGTTLASRKRYDEALRDFDRAADTLSRLVEKEGRAELTNDLAVTLNDRALALDSLDRCNDAVKDYDRVIEIRSRLVTQERHAELASSLATALSNRSLCHTRLRRLDLALRDLSQAVDILARQVDREGRTELAAELSAALNNRASVLWTMGQFDQALADCGKAVDIRTRLVEREGRAELTNELAKSLILRGMLRMDQGDDLPGAEADFQRARRLATDQRLQEDSDQLLQQVRAQLRRDAIMPPPR